MKKVIAIIGKPNVGKSTLFNRLIQKNESIVHSEPGVTRDRLYGELEWLNNKYIVIDTGGIQIENASFQKEINIQASLAITEADIILFVVNQIEGVRADDEYVAKILSNSQKEVILCVNKCDNPKTIYDFQHHWEQFGFKNIFHLSAAHGINVGDLLSYISKKYPNEEEQEDTKNIIFSFVGKPNVGKSSLTNSIFKEPKVLVSNIPGTTRDPVYLNFSFNNKNYKIVDTAGIKRISKLHEKVEQISLIKTKLAIERSHVVCLILDGSDEMTSMDLNIASLILQSKKPLLIIVNKSDIISETLRKEYNQKISYELNFAHNVPILYTSAIKNKNIFSIFKYLDEIEKECKLIWKKEELMLFMKNLEVSKPPQLVSGKTVSLESLKQINKFFAIPTFMLTVNDPKLLASNYKKFIVNKLEKFLNLKNVRINLVVSKK